MAWPTDLELYDTIDSWFSPCATINKKKTLCYVVSAGAYIAYGGDQICCLLHLAIPDADINSAFEILVFEGYRPSDFAGMILVREGNEFDKIMLATDSWWHLDSRVRGSVVEYNDARMVSTWAYLTALVEIVATSLLTIGTWPSWFHWQLGQWTDLVNANYGQLEAAPIMPCDKFFIRHYRRIRSLKNGVKLAQLWKKLREGDITVEHAEEQAPKPRQDWRYRMK
ncbi:hypothetical protein BDQ12DRAFT_673144 [Crucibulum laeve]|uniref:Uncharacterized protein n=1 Tax=Crucibulum laeve TaxID=68775 RepID=A0A5C3MIK9_9AGAR|nr:hypothetical protein BDQ12DRAFT_673144 [Crucibulum laeve]